MKKIIKVISVLIFSFVILNPSYSQEIPAQDNSDVVLAAENQTEDEAAKTEASDDESDEQENSAESTEQTAEISENSDSDDVADGTEEASSEYETEAGDESDASVKALENADAAEQTLETEQTQDEQTAAASEAEKDELYEKMFAARNSYFDANKDRLTAKDGADELITEIEAKKQEIFSLQSTAQAKAQAFNEAKDAETNAQLDAILNAPYDELDLNEDGTPSSVSIELRQTKATEIEAAADAEKVAKAEEFNKEISANDKEYRTQLEALYTQLETGSYTTNSYNDDIQLLIGKFNARLGAWPVTVTSSFFGGKTLLTKEIEIPYSAITGKKFKSIKKMNTKEFSDYSDLIRSYDNLLCGENSDLYAVVTYKIKKWSWASQYRFEPAGIEICRLGTKGKTVYKCTADDLEKVLFKMEPEVEVRTEDEIIKEQKKISERLEKEQKDAAKKAWAEAKNTKESLISSSSSVKATSSVTDTSVKQKGRGAAIVAATTSFGQGEISNFKTETISLDALSLEAAFPLGKFFFVGVNAAMYNPIDGIAPNFEAGIDMGLNMMWGHYVRPYIKGTFNLDDDYHLMGKAGLGFDFIIVKLAAVNLGFDFTWKYDYGARFNITDRGNDASLLNTSHNFYAGVGVAW